MPTEKEELQARRAGLRAERDALGNPMHIAVVAQRHASEEARIDKRLGEIDAGLPVGVEEEIRAATFRAGHAELVAVDPLNAVTSPDLLIRAKRAEIRAARERLESENPMAAAAFVLRNGWAFLENGGENQ